MNRPLRILWGWSSHPDPRDAGRLMRSWAQEVRLAVPGIELELFDLGLGKPCPLLPWPGLDRAWRRGDRSLLALHQRLARACEGQDAFVNGQGINVHPDFVPHLPCLTVFSCCDDPEASELLSRPAAAAYDLALVANIAELPRYRSWGVREPRFWPLGWSAIDRDHTVTRQRILEEERPVALSLVCDRLSPWRRERLDAFAGAFPDGVYRGTGWPGGILAEAERVPLMARTRIAPNFHNSTGPVNSRTYCAPANGALLLCDNRSHLAELYRPGVEAVGFDSVAEAVELCHHYLAHEDERRAIACAGWERALRDYSVAARFRQLAGWLRQALEDRRVPPAPAPMELLAARRQSTRTAQAIHLATTPLRGVGRAARYAGRLLGRLTRRAR